jgi:acetyl esterase/lipase
MLLALYACRIDAALDGDVVACTLVAQGLDEVLVDELAQHAHRAREARREVRWTPAPGTRVRR